MGVVIIDKPEIKVDTGKSTETEIENRPDIIKERWFVEYWRPAAAWTYLLICIFDFMLFPLIMIFLPIITKAVYVAWVPITLANGGLIHLAFGSLLGIYAWSRTREKLQGASNFGEMLVQPQPTITSPSIPSKAT